MAKWERRRIGKDILIVYREDDGSEYYLVDGERQYLSQLRGDSVMRFELFIECDNAAFEGSNRAPEVARLLRSAADKIRERGLEDGTEIRLHDFNGNRVGTCVFKGDSDASTQTD